MEKMEVDNITDDQIIQCWGRTASGELGLAGDEDKNVRLPQTFPPLCDKNKLVQVACGKQHSVFLLENGLVYSCGLNDHKQLGHDNDGSVPGLNIVMIFRIVR